MCVCVCARARVCVCVRLRPAVRYSIVPNVIGPPGLFIGTCDKDDPGNHSAPFVHRYYASYNHYMLFDKTDIFKNCIYKAKLNCAL